MSGFSSCKNQKLFQKLFSLTQDRSHEENSNAIWRCFIRCYPNSTQNIAHEMGYSGWFLKDGGRKGRSMQAHSQYQQVLSILWFQKWVGIDTSILSPENWIPLCLVWKDNGGAHYTTSTKVLHPIGQIQVDNTYSLNKVLCHIGQIQVYNTFRVIKSI